MDEQSQNWHAGTDPHLSPQVPCFGDGRVCWKKLQKHKNGISPIGHHLKPSTGNVSTFTQSSAIRILMQCLHQTSLQTDGCTLYWNKEQVAASVTEIVAELHLLKLLSSRWIKHPEAVVEGGLRVPIDLPGEGQGDVQSVIHVVCGRAMRKIACSTRWPLSSAGRGELLC